jgi:hypothetical protein
VAAGGRLSRGGRVFDMAPSGRCIAWPITKSPATGRALNIYWVMKHGH